MKTVYVPQRGTLKEMEFEDVMDAIGLIAKDDDEFCTFQIEQMPGIGIIALDQDTTTAKETRLGIKGHFLVLGMERLAPGTEANPHMFRSLTQEELMQVRSSLTWSHYRRLQQLMAEEGESEV